MVILNVFEKITDVYEKRTLVVYFLMPPKKCCFCYNTARIKIAKRALYRRSVHAETGPKSPSFSSSNQHIAHGAQAKRQLAVDMPPL
jgi:hypothetical protein